MSPAFSRPSDRLTFCSVSSATICADTDSNEPIDSAGSIGEPTLTAITTSGAHSACTSRIGTLSTRPPSTILRPSISAGAISPGTDMLARIAWVRLPSRNTTLAPVPMSVATIDSGRRRAAMSGSPRSARTSWLMKSLIFWPDTAPGG